MATSSPDQVLDIRAQSDPPFGTIMRALGELSDDETLRLITDFEPVPLYGVLTEKGFTHEAAQIAGDEWHIHISPD